MSNTTEQSRWWYEDENENPAQTYAKVTQLPDLTDDLPDLTDEQLTDEHKEMLKKLKETEREVKEAEENAKLAEAELEARKAEEDAKEREEKAQKEITDKFEKKMEELEKRLKAAKQRTRKSQSAIDKLDGFEQPQKKQTKKQTNPEQTNPENTTQETKNPTKSSTNVPKFEQCNWYTCGEKKFGKSTMCKEHTASCKFDGHPSNPESKCTNDECVFKHICRSGKCNNGLGMVWKGKKPVCESCDRMYE